VPVLQCLQVKALTGQPGSADRYRIVLSDINNYVQAMLATQVNHLIHDEKLVRNCIVRITQYQPNSVKGKKYVMDSQLSTRVA
jgi:replication factor A1